MCELIINHSRMCSVLLPSTVSHAFRCRSSSLMTKAYPGKDFRHQRGRTAPTGMGYGGREEHTTGAQFEIGFVVSYFVSEFYYV
jgi:hypothetical protein